VALPQCLQHQPQRLQHRSSSMQQQQGGVGRFDGLMACVLTVLLLCCLARTDAMQHWLFNW
jgi:hypothetical protein